MSYDPNDPSQNDQNLSQADKAAQASSGSSQSQPDTTDAQPSTSNGGGGGVATAGTAPSSGTAQGSTPSKSGSWTNLQSYLDANSDQGAKVGADIAGTVNQAGNQAQNDISNLNTNFNQDVQNNTIAADPNAVQGAIGAATSLKAGESLGQDQLDAFNKQANATYSGPSDVTSYGSYGQTQQDLNKATTLANQTQSEDGRDVLLNNQYQNASANGYNQGENNLDQLLLQNSDGGKAALQPLAQQWSGLTGALQNTIDNGKSAAQAAAQTNQATAAAAKAALNTGTQSFQDQINTGLAALKQTNQAAYGKILSDIKSGQLTPEDGKALGLDTIGNNFGVDGSNYLTQGAQPTLQNYATADQYAQAAALAQLAGQSSSAFLSPGSVGQAGAAQTAPAYSFNADQYKSNIAANKAEYNNAQNDTLTRINAMTQPHGVPWYAPGYFKSMDDAVQTLNYNVQHYTGSPSSGYRDLAAQSLQALDQINAMNARYNQPLYPVYGESALPYGVGGKV